MTNIDGTHKWQAEKKEGLSKTACSHQSCSGAQVSDVTDTGDFGGCSARYRMVFRRGVKLVTTNIIFQKYNLESFVK